MGQPDPGKIFGPDIDLTETFSTSSATYFPKPLLWCACVFLVAWTLAKNMQKKFICILRKVKIVFSDRATFLLLYSDSKDLNIKSFLIIDLNQVREECHECTLNVFNIFGSEIMVRVTWSKLLQCNIILGIKRSLHTVCSIQYAAYLVTKRAD